jgi:hypothetical protein
MKIRRKAIDRITQKRWRSTMNVFVAICTQYVQDVYINVLGFLEGGPIIGPSLEIFKMCCLNKKMSKLTKVIYGIDNFDTLDVLDSKQRILQVLEQEPSYKKYQHSKKAVRNFKNSWNSQIFGSNIFTPVSQCIELPSQNYNK